MKIRQAVSADLAAIVAIYNQAIPLRYITADLEPVDMTERQPWFDFHQNNPKYPIWVLENDQHILGWCSFSPFYLRAAFDNTAELSIYLDEKAKGKGYGSQAIQFMQQQMAKCDIHTLMAYVIERNTASRKLFEKQGFIQWGKYPNIANMGDKLETFLMYGYQKLPQNK